MGRLRMLGPAIVSVLVGMSATPGCGTDAVGVSACQDIEAARCKGAVHCPDLFAVDDAKACELFYRDHCLHGLSAPNEPGAPALRRCVSAIEAATTCAARGTDLEDCDGVDASGETSTACELIQYPERIDACAFLLEQSEPETEPDETTPAAGAGGVGAND